MQLVDRLLITIKRNKVLTTLFSFFIIYGLWSYIENRDLIAEVGIYKIRTAEFVKEMNYRKGDYTNLENKQKLLDELIEKKLLLNKASKLDLLNDPDIQRKIEYLLMGHIKSTFLENQLSKININPDECKVYYEKNKESFAISAQREFAILFYKKGKKEDSIRKKKVLFQLTEVIQQSLQESFPPADKGFGKYAISNSEHQVSRYRGGIIGWFTQENKKIWEPDVISAGFQLKNIGDISKVVETNKGYYLVRLVNTKPKRYKEFDKVSSQIKHQLFLKEQNRIKTEFKKQLEDDFDIEIYTDVLEKTPDFRTIPKTEDKTIPKSFF
jgi:hypothetical protein